MCLFCDLAKHNVIENDLCYMIYDKFPVAQGHSLIIPKRHIETVFEMNSAEWSSAGDLIKQAKAEIEKTVDIINEAFTELLNKLFQATVFDVTTDAQVLQTMLAKEGLTKNDFSEDKK